VNRNSLVEPFNNLNFVDFEVFATEPIHAQIVQSNKTVVISRNSQYMEHLALWL
jgi:hypothetical protein